MMAALNTPRTPPPIEQQARRIRWQTGVSETAARTIAGFVFGEGR